MKGICNCGRVSFDISGNFPALYQCHCSLCQKQSGAGSNAATIVKIENFEWKSGFDSIKKWKKNTGFNSHFCEYCGSPVPNPFGSEYMWIPVGLMGNTNTEVIAHVWLSSKAPWDRPSSVQRNYEGMPDNLEEFVEFLHSGIHTK